MKSIILLCLMLCCVFLYAEYVPQSLLFSSLDEIETITAYSDPIYTDCEWFNTLSRKHRIHYLELLYDYWPCPIFYTTCKVTRLLSTLYS